MVEVVYRKGNSEDGLDIEYRDTVRAASYN